MTTLAEDCAALSDEQCKEIDRVRLDMVEAITQAMQTALKQIPEDGSAFERVAAHMIACTASMVTCTASSAAGEIRAQVATLGILESFPPRARVMRHIRELCVKAIQASPN
jgi:hypothetical protein